MLCNWYRKKRFRAICKVHASRVSAVKCNSVANPTALTLLTQTTYCAVIQKWPEYLCSNRRFIKRKAGLWALSESWWSKSWLQLSINNLSIYSTPLQRSIMVHAYCLLHRCSSSACNWHWWYSLARLEIKWSCKNLKIPSISMFIANYIYFWFI